MGLLSINTRNSFFRHTWVLSIGVLGIACMLAIGLYAVRKLLRHRQEMRYYRSLFESLLHFQYTPMSEQQP